MLSLLAFWFYLFLTDFLSFLLFLSQTRMQALSPAPGTPHYRNVGNALKTIVRQEGLSRTLRGLPLVATGAGPSHALYFACYEKLKTVLSAHPGKNPFANGTSVVIRNMSTITVLQLFILSRTLSVCLFLLNVVFFSFCPFAKHIFSHYFT